MNTSEGVVFLDLQQHGDQGVQPREFGGLSEGLLKLALHLQRLGAPVSLLSPRAEHRSGPEWAGRAVRTQRAAGGVLDIDHTEVAGVDPSSFTGLDHDRLIAAQVLAYENFQNYFDAVRPRLVVVQTHPRFWNQNVTGESALTAAVDAARSVDAKVIVNSAEAWATYPRIRIHVNAADTAEMRLVAQALKKSPVRAQVVVKADAAHVRSRTSWQKAFDEVQRRQTPFDVRYADVALTRHPSHLLMLESLVPLRAGIPLENAVRISPIDAPAGDANTTQIEFIGEDGRSAHTRISRTDVDRLVQKLDSLDADQRPSVSVAGELCTSDEAVWSHVERQMVDEFTALIRSVDPHLVSDTAGLDDTLPR